MSRDRGTPTTCCEDVEIARRMLEKFVATGELSDELAADVIWDMSTFRGWPDQPMYRGVEGFEEFLSAWREPYDDWSMAVEEFLDAGGDQVVAIVTQRGRLPGSDADVALPYGLVHTIKNRKVQQAQVYTTAQEAPKR